jgi:hypothetical protein
MHVPADFTQIRTTVGPARRWSKGPDITFNPEGDFGKRDRVQQALNRTNDSGTE